MATANRPLSPHLQIYKPQLTSVLSITHRGTSLFLSVGSLVLAWWLFSIASGPGDFASAQSHLTAWYGQLALLAWVFSFYYHLCNGIRHLFWDVGMGLEIESAYRSGYIVLGVSLLLAVATLILGYANLGGVA